MGRDDIYAPSVGLSEKIRIWEDALIIDGEKSLRESLTREVSRYFTMDVSAVERKFRKSVGLLKDKWLQAPPERSSDVREFYVDNELYIFDLMNWHTLLDNYEPLKYVDALLMAQKSGAITYLDYGAGVGSGAILFAKNGLKSYAADISIPNMEFMRWRFRKRGLDIKIIDLNREKLPAGIFDFATAFDVLEHVPDPVENIREIRDSLAARGRFATHLNFHVDDERPMHVIHSPHFMYGRVRALGFSWDHMGKVLVLGKVERSKLANRILGCYDPIRSFLNPFIRRTITPVYERLCNRRPPK
jgi:SAM-dependent methyltransferase